MQRYREIVLNLEAGVAVYSAVGEGADFVFADLNPAGERICQIGRDRIIGKRVSEVFPGIADLGLLDVFRRVWRTGQAETLGARRYGDARIALWVENHVFKLGSGEIVALFVDVSARVKAEDALRQSEEKLKQAQALAHLGYWDLDLTTGQAQWSDEEYRLLGYTPGGVAASAENFMCAVHPDDHAAVAAEMQRAMDPTQTRPYQIRHRVVTPQGERVVEERGHVSFAADGRPLRMFGTTMDITEIVRAEKSLFLYANVFEHSGEATIITDRDNRIIAVNPAFIDLSGYSFAEVAGQNPRMLSAGRTPPETYRQMWAALEHEGYWQGELWDRRKNGEVFPKWAAISAIRAASGTVSHYVGSFNDISERKAAEERIHFLAHHDALTGLANRHSFESRLEQALLTAQREQTRLAVLFIDLDRFKTINDTLGHPVGDRMLQEVAVRLRSCVRASDIAARLGGDEFVVVLTHIVETVDAAAVAEKILRLLTADYAIDAYVLHSSASIGIGIFPTDGQDRMSLMKNADAALYFAKERGRNNYQFFTAAMNAAAEERMTIERELHAALQGRQFELHYQPKVVANSGRVCGVEALVRWRHPELGLVPPDKFIPVAEETGQIEPLGAWVLEEACHQLAEWRRAGIDRLHMAVNLSARQLRAPGLIDNVRDLLTRYGLAEGDLELEITESVAMAEPETAIDQLLALRALGIRLAIDDFGTGYSSLAYLKRLPIQILKLDRAFVRDIETDPNDAVISTATLALAHSLGLQVVAEGVENAAQRDFLTSRGCDMLQGYLYGRPAPAVDWTALWSGGTP